MSPDSTQFAPETTVIGLESVYFPFIVAFFRTMSRMTSWNGRRARSV